MTDFEIMRPVSGSRAAPTDCDRRFLSPPMSSAPARRAWLWAARVGILQKFCKVSALINLLHKVNVQRTFENLVYLAIAEALEDGGDT